MKSEFNAPIDASRRENSAQPNLLIQILFRSPAIAKTSYPNFRLARWKSMCKVQAPAPAMLYGYNPKNFRASAARFEYARQCGPPEVRKKYG